MSQSHAFLDRLRRQEHTGENRCMPCTVVNVVLAVLLTAIAAVLAVELAAAVLVLSVLAIYFRGYLVPYTPTLTTRYLPESVLRALGKDPHPEPARPTATWEAVEKLENHRENAVDLEAFLVDSNIVAPETDDERAPDYQLTPAFATHVDAYLDEIADEDIDAETVATLFDRNAADVTEKDRDYPAYEVGVRIRKWPSEAALVVDIATHRALDAWTDDWRSVPEDQRADILERLRGYREECPVCGGRVSETNETVDSCCVSVEKYAFRCEDCDTHLREYGMPTQRDGKGLTGA